MPAGQKSDLSNQLHYLTRAHLGSVDSITTGAGVIEVRLSSGAFGQRRKEAGWSGNPTSGDWTQITASTRHGFTFHEHLDNLNLVHMNGRVYDPVVGRFLSADPFVPYPASTQSFNRYSYVRNNPLTFTDPSGFSDRRFCERSCSSSGRAQSSSSDYLFVTNTRIVSGTGDDRGQSWRAPEWRSRRQSQWEVPLERFGEGMRPGAGTVGGTRSESPQGQQPYGACTTYGGCTPTGNRPLTAGDWAILGGQVVGPLLALAGPEALIAVLSRPVLITDLTVGAADTAAGGVLGGGALAVTVKEISAAAAAGKSIRQAVIDINRTGLSQADAVKVIETVVRASGREVGGIVVRLADGSIAMLGKFAGVGQPVVLISQNGAAVFGAATVRFAVDGARGVVTTVTDFVPK
jgi:RHS repeat-associated protein